MLLETGKSIRDMRLCLFGSRWHGALRSRAATACCVGFFTLARTAMLAAGAEAAGVDTAIPSGLIYTNDRVASVPWSVHVVQWARTNSAFEFHSAHAGRAAVGLSTLSAQLDLFDLAQGTPVAAVNGDYYQRDRAFAGDPRGLQIVASEVISAPAGGVSFWIDGSGQPYGANVISLFKATWPDGTVTSFGLNEERPPNALVLYTAAAGASTPTLGGREIILEHQGEGPWLPLRMGCRYAGRVREVREGGNAPLATGTMVLSMGPGVPPLPQVDRGAVVRLVTGSSPDLAGVGVAISGGPVLLRKGRAQRIETPASESYEFSSMFERHPRTALGWSRSDFFLVTVDGRQKDVSVGMTLKELAAYLAKLGCEEAINLDGGGSATLWCAGKVRNRPCDGRERVIANSLVLVRKPAGAGGGGKGASESAK